MKKIIFSLMAVGLLFSACSSDDNLEASAQVGEGSLKGLVTFEGVKTRAASATNGVIPVTSWDNVKQVQMFLYKADGEVAFSYTIYPTATLTQFQWSHIPVGTYTLALVANAKSNTDNVSTYLAGGTDTPVLWNDYNTRGLKVNSQLFIDLKKKSNLPAAHNWSGSLSGYEETSEIFTAYAAEVKIEEGVTTDLTAAPLTLLREVSLMRARFNTSKIPTTGVNQVKFNTALSYIAVQRQPVGFGLKLGSFAGGIYATPKSDIKRVMIAAEGVGTYLTANPGYGTILKDGFTMYRDIRVLPNATMAENKAANADAEVDRKYNLIIAGQVEANYKYADGTIAAGTQAVYWYANVNGVFTKNSIREANVTITSAGYPEIPVEPTKEGGLIIKMSAPQNWNSNIESENIEV